MTLRALSQLCAGILRTFITHSKPTLLVNPSGSLLLGQLTFANIFTVCQCAHYEVQPEPWTTRTFVFLQTWVQIFTEPVPALVTLIEFLNVSDLSLQADGTGTHMGCSR